MFILDKRENLTQPIQSQLCKKLKMFSQFFIRFLKSTFSFEQSEKKDEPHSLCFSEIIDSERLM